MKLGELLEKLMDLHTTYGGDCEVLLGIQPSYPIELTISKVFCHNTMQEDWELLREAIHRGEFENSEELAQMSKRHIEMGESISKHDTIYILEGEHKGYANPNLWNE